MASLYGKCDECEQPATSMARDSVRHIPPGSEYGIVRQTGPVKRGCDNHPVRAIQDISTEPAPAGDE